MAVKSSLGAIALALLASLALAAPASPQEAAPYLLPDLRPLRPSDLIVDRADGDRTLRFTMNVLNRGTGPLELHPKEEDCDQDGDASNDRTAYQQLFVDDGSGEFERGVDVSEERPAGCQHFHEAHQHWHFDDFGVYKLFRYSKKERLVQKVVARANKVSFCLVDTYPKLDLPGSPATRFYHSASGSECGQNTITGISIGWVDNYSYTLAGQSLPVEKLRDGFYCLRVRTDPRRLLEETKDNNNARSVRFRLTGMELRLPNNPRCV